MLQPDASAAQLHAHDQARGSASDWGVDSVGAQLAASAWPAMHPFNTCASGPRPRDQFGRGNVALTPRSQSTVIAFTLWQRYEVSDVRWPHPFNIRGRDEREG